jgi:PAS domain S-box-containing protein
MKLLNNIKVLGLVTGSVLLFSFLLFFLFHYHHLQNILSKNKIERTNHHFLNHCENLQSSIQSLDYIIIPSIISQGGISFNEFEATKIEVIKEIDSIKNEMNVVHEDRNVLVLDSLLSKKIFTDSLAFRLSEKKNVDSAMSLITNTKYLLQNKRIDLLLNTITKSSINQLTIINERLVNFSKQAFRQVFLFMILSFLFLVIGIWRLIRQYRISDRLFKTNKLFTEIVNNSFESIIVLDSDFRITYVNKSTEELFKITFQNSLGKKEEDAFNSITTQKEIERKYQFLKNNGYWKGMNSFFSKDNEPIYCNTTINQIKNERGEVLGYFSTHSDITKLKKAYRKIENFANALEKENKNLEEISNKAVLRSKRILDFFGKVNEAILTAKSDSDIYQSVCEIAINSAGYRFAFIAKPDFENNTIVPLFWAGNEAGYLGILKNTISIQNNSGGNGPTGKAIREGKFYYSNNIANDAKMEIWKEEALKREFRSSIAFPIIVHQNVIAVVTFYAHQIDAFNQEEISILQRVIENIVFGITAIEIENEKALLINNLRKVKQAVEQSEASIVITDLEGNIEYVNPAFSKLTGYSLNEVLGKNPRILQSGVTPKNNYNQLWQNITNALTWTGEFCNKKKNGELYWEYASIAPILDDNGNVINYVAVKENITDRKIMELEQQKLYNMLESSEAYVFIIGMNGRLQYSNNAFKRAFHISESASSLINLENCTLDGGFKFRNEILPALSLNNKWEGEIDYRCNNGEIITVLQVSILHKDVNQQPSHISNTAIDITARKKIEVVLKEKNEELINFSRHLQEVTEVEKREIAREIHDELGQYLTLIKFNATWLKEHADIPSRELIIKIDELINNITNTINAFRSIQGSLHPVMLEELGLDATLRWLVNSIHHSNDLPIEYFSNFSDTVLSYRKSLVLYRIAQESITNIMRYANASVIKISLILDENKIILLIEDNGIGFEVDKVDTKLHHGLLGMRERVYSINGSLTIESNLGTGTSISVIVDVDD